MSTSTAEDRVNMVPLIDCMFFLILFFMVVMRFAPDERSLAGMLPTAGGANRLAPPPTLITPIVIAIHPAGLERGLQPSDYERAYGRQVRDGSFDRAVCIRVGGSAPLVIHGGVLATADSDGVQATIARELAARESPGRPRTEQPEVQVRCFSGQSWKYAVLAYDAVRAYEAHVSGRAVPRDASELADARTVSFAAPPIRHGTAREAGNELYEIIHAK